MISNLRALVSRLRALFTIRRLDDDFAQELDSHLALLTDENIRKGMSEAEARRAARLELGNPVALRDSHHDQRTFPFIESVIQDVRFALRMLRKNPAFTATAVLTLALGIGANTAIFSVIDGILWRPLPYAHTSQLAAISISKQVGQGEFSSGIPLGQVKALWSDTPGIEQLATYAGTEFTRTDGESPELLVGARVSGNFFSTMGANPLLGRSITPLDAQPSHDGVAVLSYTFWRDRFGSDPHVVGRNLTLNHVRCEIVGVMPRYFEFPANMDAAPLALWTPLVVNPADESNRAAGASMIARLKIGVTREALNAQLKTVAPRFWPELPPLMNGAQIQAQGIAPILGNLETPLLVLAGAVAFVLLIACVNVSALLLGRGWSRQREIAMRKALGASKGRILRQLLTEGLLIAFSGAGLAILLAGAGVRFLRAMAPPNQPRIAQAQIDSHVLIYTLAVSLVACVLFALLPALQVSATNLGQAIKGDVTGAFSALSRRPNRLRNALVIFEIASAVVLVMGAALMSRSLNHLVRANVGFRVDHILTASASLSPSICDVGKQPRKCIEATREIVNAIAGNSDVEAAAAASTAPVDTSVAMRIQIQGQAGGLGFASGQFIAFRDISTDYFRAVGVPLLAGRPFDAADTAESQPVAIVNHTFVTQFLGSANPLDAHFSIQDGPTNGATKLIDVVGVVADSQDEGSSLAAHRVDPEYYIPFAQLRGAVQPHLVVRTAIDPLALLPAIRRDVASVDKDAPLTDVETMDQVVADSVAEPKFETALLASFGILGLALALVGAYGVISYRVAQRTHEIGVRMALGAQPRGVLRLVLREALLLAVAGVFAGLCGAFALTRFLRSLLFEIGPTDPATFAAVAVLLMIVVLAASYIPARRAMRVDPMVALRHE